LGQKIKANLENEERKQSKRVILLPEQQKNPISRWRCELCGLEIKDMDSNSFRQRVIYHRKMHT
jgi:hypothetical protein